VDLLLKLGILIVETMFVTGAIGSALVIVWVGLEDFRTIFKAGDEKE
jgi:hypothetical protein